MTTKGRTTAALRDVATWVAATCGVSSPPPQSASAGEFAAAPTRPFPRPTGMLRLVLLRRAGGLGSSELTYAWPFHEDCASLQTYSSCGGFCGE